jgi:hypothetical protein
MMKECRFECCGEVWVLLLCARFLGEKFVFNLFILDLDRGSLDGDWGDVGRFDL